MIDLRSDTVTKPCRGMLDAMMSAETGDDVYGEDPTVNRLEKQSASIFGMESALFCASGTMSNQVGINVHTRPGDEVICDMVSHVYLYEGGAIARLSGSSVSLIQGERGRFTAADVVERINPDDVHKARTSLVTVENTVNRGGGTCWDITELKRISILCRDRGLLFHMDGARIFNAMTETGDTPQEFGKIFDSISICLSKGLGAPVGSILLGKSDFISRARRVRKAIGGGMRQAGYLAAAGIYALENNIERLEDDHRRAKILGRTLSGLDYVESVLPVETNIVIFRIKNSENDKGFISKLGEEGILATVFAPGTIRFVTHLDFTETMLDKTVEVLKKLRF